MASGGCEVRKKEVVVQQLEVKMNISYAEAAKRAQRERGGNVVRKEPAQQPSEQLSTKSQRGDENIMAVNKENFVFFMAEVVNCTFQAKGRSETI